MDLCISFRALMEPFASLFGAQNYALWQALMTGWVLSQRHRFISDLIVSSNSTRKGAWCNYYRFFNRYKWSVDQVCRVLLMLILTRLVPANAVIILAVDDTLCRKRGLGLFGVGMHHDPLISSKGKKLTSWGHSWVVVTVVIQGLSWAPDLAWSLPIGFRLYVNQQGVTKGKGKTKKRERQKRAQQQRAAGHRTRPELAVELLTMIAGWFPQREFLLTGDSLYGGRSVVQHLPPNLHLISRAPWNAALYAPPSPPPKDAKGPGRPRKKGVRLPTIDEWAEDPRSRWTTYAFDQYGLHTIVRWKWQDALYYQAGKSRLMRIILVEDLQGKRGRQVFFCTNPQLTVPFILRTYALRWSIEVTFENCKQLLGIADPANRKEEAVRRTAPMAGVLYGLIVLWFDAVGHEHVQFPDRPWYPQKRDASFGDMLTTLRRLSWNEKTTPLIGNQGPLKAVVDQLTYFLCLAG